MKKTLISILIIILVLCSGIIINGTCFEKYTPSKYHYEWMKHVDDPTYVKEIIMPGSHDAGSYNMNWLGETQQFNIANQLNLGVRYFDIRVNKKENGDLVIFHSVIDGVDFLPILESFRNFIIENPSETILIDFQHFKGGSQEDVYKLITEYLYDTNLLVVNDTDLSDLEFINQLRLKAARGKCIIFWGDRTEDFSNYLFLRNNDECSHSNMSLNSYYLSEYHYKSFDYLANNGYPIYFNNIIKKIENEGKGIFVLQAQLTDKNMIFGPYSREQRYGDEISEYIKSLKNKEELRYINVIMRDFYNVEKADEIIELNYDKGILSYDI